MNSQEVEVDFVKVQLRQSGSYMVTIPKQAAEALNITNGEKLKVSIDSQKKRIIYQKI
ncbi:MAG: AbrB/MazE/SpoVT family DNA-binding domain-containing protein [Candidatus Jordarchaeaceae archaeon]